MPLPATETLTDAKTMDALPAFEAVGQMVALQRGALDAVEKAGPELARGAECMAQAIYSGNSIIYAAAGSSGLMALADACELPGTFGIPHENIQIHMAGGVPVDGRMTGETEDDVASAGEVALNVEPGDVVIVLSASGTTPYAVHAAQAAKERGAKIIGIANNRDTVLLQESDVAICLETPPEAIAGSTRLGAGTAQKVALNLMSSLMGAKLGHVYQGMMVNLVADNAKLIKRAARIVSQISGVSKEEAQRALSEANGHVKTAVLVASGLSKSAAITLLSSNEGHLGPCIKELTSNHDLNVSKGRRP